MKALVRSLLLVAAVLFAPSVGHSQGRVRQPPVLRLPADASTETRRSNSTSDSRIQLGTYTNSAQKIFDDPMTEVVKANGYIDPITKRVINNVGWGTANFLQNCRVYTALHVLLSLKHGERRTTLEPGESLIGERFAFDTQVMANGKPLSGSFVVIGHGTLDGKDSEEVSFNDWAMGYDEECMSEKHKLGFFMAIPGQTYGLMEGQEYFTAGHSILDASKEDDQYHLYVDSKCGVTDKVPRNHKQNNFLVTTCSVAGGGSGQFLSGTRTEHGELVMGINGRPQKYAYGMFQMPVQTFGEEIPNVDSPHAIAAFSNLFYMKNIGPYIKGPVNLTPLSVR